MSLKTERIKQPVVTGTTQPLKLGGILEDGSDAKMTIATDGSISTTTAVAVPSLSVDGNSVATYSDAPAFHATKSTGQAVSQNVNTKLTFETETFDTNNCFANSRFTPNIAGYYFIQYQIYCSADANFRTYIFKNGVQVRLETHTYNYSGLGFCTHLLYMNGTTDYVEIYGYPYNASRTFDADAQLVHFAGYLVRKA